MSEGNHSERQLIYLALGFILVFFFLRIPIFGAIALRLLLGVIAALLLFLGYRMVLYLRKRQLEKRFRKTTQGQISSKIEQCRDLLERNTQEIKDIQRNIQDLKAKTEAASAISEEHRRESSALLADFQSELKLRHTKEHFYHSCIRKLETIQQQQQLASEIKEKKERLRELRENQYEKLAQLEEMKSDLEMDTFYLKTIDELSSKLLLTKTVDDAEHLRLELEEMTRELDDL